MPSFVVTHLDLRRRVVRQRVAAADESDALGALGVPAHSVLAVEADRSGGRQIDASRPGDSDSRSPEARSPGAAWWRPPAATTTRLGAQQRRLFSAELAVLLDAGIPLLEAVVTLREKEAAPRVAAALGRVLGALREGRPLSAGLREPPAVFDGLFVATVEASERTGQLTTALRRHAVYLAWTETLRGRLVAAAVYPAMLIAAGSAVLVFLLLFVVPRFAGLLDDVGGDLPAASRALLALGRVGGEQPWLIVGGALALLAAPALAWRSAALRDALRSWSWRWPLIGPRLRLLELALLYRSAGMLLGAGVPLVPALQTCAPLLGGRWRGALLQATQSVRAGARLSDSLDAHGLCTPVSRRMLRVGERTGELAAMLERAAAFYDEELLRIAELVTRVVNPLLMLAMGVVIGAVVLLMYLPIFQLAERIQ